MADYNNSEAGKARTRRYQEKQQKLRARRWTNITCDVCGKRFYTHSLSSKLGIHQRCDTAEYFRRYRKLNKKIKSKPRDRAD